MRKAHPLITIAPVRWPPVFNSTLYSRYASPTPEPLARWIHDEVVDACHAQLELIRSSGHLLKGRYDVPNGSRLREATTTPAV